MSQPDQRPTPSILVLAETSDRWFSSPATIAELLFLEGVNDLQAAELDELSSALLENRSLVVLGPCDPAPDVAGMLLEHVRSGGGLICFGPGEAFASRLGLNPQFKGLMHGRVPLAVDGFPDATLPVKGWSQFYTLKAGQNAVEMAPLLDSAGQPCGRAALFEIRLGRGKIFVLAYDLSTCVCLLRQGNPLLAGCRSSGFQRMRPSDLFDGWDDPQDFGLPVADLHTHFLRELVHKAWPGDTVLPWWWYFPNNAETFFLLTSDDDWSTRDHFERLISSCEAHDARLTFYIVKRHEPSGRESVMDRQWLEDLERRGFDFSIHPDLPPPTRPLWKQRLAEHVRQFESAYGRPPSSSVRNHCITWSGYIEGARIESQLGFRVDANTFSLLPQGRYYMNGAGLPLPFVDLDGEVLPIFQLPTQFSDETTLGGQGFQWSLNLTPDQGVDLITRLMMENAAAHHSMMCVNAHPISFATYSAPLWEPVMQFARSKAIPVWNVDRFHRFWQARRSIRLRPIPKGQTTPEFPGPARAAHGLTAMIPVSDSDTQGRTRTLGGRRFLCHSCA